MSMRYITKVDDVHVVEIGGVNHQIPEEVVKYSDCDDPQLHFNGCTIAPDFSVSLSVNRVHLAAIVLAVEVARFIWEVTKDEVPKSIAARQ